MNTYPPQAPHMKHIIPLHTYGMCPYLIKRIINKDLGKYLHPLYIYISMIVFFMVIFWHQSEVLSSNICGIHALLTESKLYDKHWIAEQLFSELWKLWGLTSVTEICEPQPTWLYMPPKVSLHNESMSEFLWKHSYESILVKACLWYKYPQYQYE